MKRLLNLFRFIILLMSLLFSSFSSAVIERSGFVFMKRGKIEINGPADSFGYNYVVEVLGFNDVGVLCSSPDVNYTLGSIRYRNLMKQISNSTTSYYLYDINYPGLAYAPLYRTAFINRGPMQGSSYDLRPAPPEEQQIWGGYVENDKRITEGTFYMQLGANLFKTEARLPVGETPVPSTPIVQFECYGTDGVLYERYTYSTEPAKIVTTLRTCTPTGGTYGVFAMGDVPISTIQNSAIGKSILTRSRVFTLNCDPNLRVYLGLSDLVDPSNINTRVSTLTADSTGKGAAFSVALPNPLYPPEASIMLFSSPGSAPSTPNVYLYHVGNTGSDGKGVTSHTLEVSLVRTDEEVKQGTLKSIVGITYSYQ